MTESLDFYWKLARQLIRIYGRKSWLRDNEKIGHVANAIIRADVKYDSYTGSKEGYRLIYAKFAILKLFKKDKKLRKHESLTALKQEIYYNDSFIDEVDYIDLIEYIKKANIVSDVILQQIIDRVIYDHSIIEIADKYNITRQSVITNIDRGLKKIRKEIINEYF